MSTLPRRSAGVATSPGAAKRWRAGARCAGTWLLAALGSGCALLQPPAATGTPDMAAGPSAPQAIVLVVNAPPPLKALLEKYLDLARLQQFRGEESLSAGELNRLVRAAPAQARELLQTEGYFDAQVTVQRSGRLAARSAEARATARTEATEDAAALAAAEPGADAAGTVTVRVTVLPGLPTRVTGLQIQAEGELASRAAAGDADAQALQRSLPEAALLQPREVLRNSDWAATKQALVGRLRAAGYAAATLADSSADVDADTQSARLQVQLASGPLFQAGALQISGLQHQDESSVRNLAGFGPGATLTETRLLDYQDRLQKSRLFQSVSVSFEPETAGAAATPVRVRLAELPLQQATAGVGISANTGPRVTLEHTHRRPLDWPLVAYNKLEWGRSAQSWTGDLQTHAGPGFYRNLLGVQVERNVSDTDIVLSQRLRLGRTQDTPRLERLYFAELLRSRQQDLNSSAQAGGATTANALSLNYHLVWRQLDNVLLPTRGVTLALQGGAGQASSHSGENGPFGRLYARFTGYLPLGDTWFGQARLEGGRILRREAVDLPDALGFRAGGDDSVRGYAYRTLAPVDAAGATVSGDILLTASLEVARPIAASLPSVWGALFIDAGRAVNRWADYRAALGYGAGLRWRSPIGPLRIDLAWADELKKLRLHLSVGITF